MLKKLTTDDVKLLKRYLKRVKYPSQDYNLTGFYLWLDEYPIYYYEKEGRYLLLFAEVHNELYALAPLCHTCTLSEAILKIETLFKTLNKKVQFCFIPSIVRAKIEAIFPNRFEIYSNRDEADYIYLANKIKTFSGKKLQKKRNHFNYFLKSYSYEFKELNPDNFDECLSLWDKWVENKSNSSTINSERKGLQRILNMHDKLDYKIYGVYVENKLEAFSICSLLYDGCLQFNVEKANPDIRGLYPFIFAKSVEAFNNNVIIVNREDDIGDENLRKSKMSYYPEDFWYKFYIKEK